MVINKASEIYVSENEALDELDTLRFYIDGSSHDVFHGRKEERDEYLREHLPRFLYTLQLVMKHLPSGACTGW